MIEPRNQSGAGFGLGGPDVILRAVTDWPGDPDVDAAMDAESLADLAAKNAPTDWPALDRAWGEGGAP